MKRFFVDKTAELGEVLEITGDEFNHLAFVLRMKVDDEVICINGQDGNDYNCKIVEIQKNKAICEIINFKKNLAEPKIEITLFQGMCKGEKLDLIAQKITELGASNLIPFDSKFCAVKGKEVNLKRLNKISHDATKQCGRAKPLQISECIKFEEMLKKLNNFNLIIFANEKEKENNLTNSNLSNENKKWQCHNNLNKNQQCRIAIIIGSEGGFDDDEIVKIINSSAISVSLGNRILRTETASILLVGYLGLYT